MRRVRSRMRESMRGVTVGDVMTLPACAERGTIGHPTSKQGGNTDGSREILAQRAPSLEERINALRDKGVVIGGTTSYNFAQISAATGVSRSMISMFANGNISHQAGAAEGAGRLGQRHRASGAGGSHRNGRG